MHRRIALLLLCLWPWFSFSQDIDKAAQSTIQKQFPKAQVVDWSQGRLDNTGDQYLSAIIQDSKSDDSQLRLVVLRKIEGRYRSVEKSKAWESHSRLNWGTKMENQTISLSEGGKSGCCSIQSSTFKFKKYGDQFRLIGVEESDSGFNLDANTEQIHYEAGKSVNHLTNEIVHWRVSGKAKEDSPWEFSGKKKRVERKFSFPATTKWEMQNFSFYDYERYELATKYLCGHIDETFTFSSIACAK